MSAMIEVSYRKPADTNRENALTSLVAGCGGAVTYREDDTADSICLTAEFASWEAARLAITKLEQAGEHVEGPFDYGNS
jgi:hypothetical protein